MQQYEESNYQPYETTSGVSDELTNVSEYKKLFNPSHSVETLKESVKVLQQQKQIVGINNLELSNNLEIDIIQCQDEIDRKEFLEKTNPKQLSSSTPNTVQTNKNLATRQPNVEILSNKTPNLSNQRLPVSVKKTNGVKFGTRENPHALPRKDKELLQNNYGPQTDVDAIPFDETEGTVLTLTQLGKRSMSDFMLAVYADVEQERMKMDHVYALMLYTQPECKNNYLIPLVNVIMTTFSVENLTSARNPHGVYAFLPETHGAFLQTIVDPANDDPVEKLAMFFMSLHLVPKFKDFWIYGEPAAKIPPPPLANREKFIHFCNTALQEKCHALLTGVYGAQNGPFSRLSDPLKTFVQACMTSYLTICGVPDVRPAFCNKKFL